MKPNIQTFLYFFVVNHFMKVKQRIPQGVIALVCVLPALNKQDQVQKMYKILIEIIQFREEVSSHETTAKEYYDSMKKEFDVERIFGEWSTPNDDDPSRKIVRDVCSIIKEQMFE